MAMKSAKPALSHSDETLRRRRAVTEWLFDVAEDVMAKGLEMVQGAVVTIVASNGYIVKVWDETTDAAIAGCATAARDAEFKQVFGVDLPKQREENKNQLARERREFEASHPLVCSCKMRFRTQRGMDMHRARSRLHPKRIKVNVMRVEPQAP